MDRLLLRTIDSPARLFELNPGLNRIGRNPTNDIRIPDASVSSFHCEILVDEHHILVRDLGSTNGTFINGNAAEESEVQFGQTLQIGTVKMMIAPMGDTGPIVRIPDFEVREPAVPAAAVLPDGSPACQKHPTVPASFTCAHCHQTFCTACVRSLSVAGAKEMHFCPVCSAVCEPLPATFQTEATSAAAHSNQKSLLGRLTQTLKLPFKR
jgi:hypothetical protein